MKALFLSRFDSFTKSALVVAEEFKKSGAEVDWTFLENRNSTGIDYSIFGFSKDTPRLTCNELLKKIELFKYDFIVIYDTGGMVRRICYYLFNMCDDIHIAKRPVIITGFPGVVFSDINTGFSNRSIADAVFLSCKYEFELYRDFCIKNNLNFNGYLWGWNFPKIQTLKHSRTTYVYADQDIIPESYEDRLYISKELIDLAKRNPDIDVVLKQRSIKGEKRLFVSKWLLADLVKKISHNRLPQNFKFKTGDVESVLSNADLLITVSSTVAVQALMSDIPTVIVSDFGINDRNGTKYFSGSGCFRTFKQIKERDIPCVNSKWLSSHISGNVFRKNIIDYLIKLSDSISRTSYSENFLKLFSPEYLNFIYKNNTNVNKLYYLICYTKNKIRRGK